MKQFKGENIRNIAFAGHGGSGKTTLAEALLYKTESTDRLGKVEDGNTVCDFDPEEIKRKTSVSMAVAPFVYNNCKVNMIDTPGLFDFAGGVYEGVRAADTVVIVVSGKSGLTVGVEKAYKLATKMNKAKAFFINKTDSERADFYKALEDLKGEFGPSVCPLVVPYAEDHRVVCYIDLVRMKAFTYTGGEPKEVPMPDTGHRIEGLTAAISEAVAETDEALFEKYFSGEPFTREELIKGVRTGIRQGVISPVFCGSSTDFGGIDLFLDGITDLLPSPMDMFTEKGYDAEGEEIELKCSDEDPFAAMVFKTIADPFVGKMSFIKVLSGELKAGAAPVIARTGNVEKVGKVLTPFGKAQKEVPVLSAGDIGVLSKLDDVITGDTLCDPKRVFTVEQTDFPTPCLTMAIKPKNKGDEGKISGALQRLIEEDRTISYENNAETRQQLLTGLGEQHLDVIVSKFRNKFGIELLLEKPIVAYRETIRKKVKVEGKHKKQTGGHGQYGHVWIEFEPCVSDDLVFEERVFGGSVPKSFFPAVEKGLRDSITKGVIAGYPMVGIKAILVDGSYHPVDSSEMSFKMAASLAYRAGIPQAGPVLLEPIGHLMALVPDFNTGDLIGDLNKRRGRVLGMNPSEEEKKYSVVDAEVPMSEMSDFATVLRSMTQGRGSFTFEFVRYEQLPQMLEAKVVEEAKALHGE